MSHFRLDYEKNFRSAGCRVTGQRTLILDAVCAGGGHTTLAEIYLRLRKVDKTIDRSTVYRTLKLFVKLGLVVPAVTGTGDTLYEIVKAEHHHHLLCRRCGREQEIDDAVFQDLITAVLAQHSFTVDTDHVVLFGACAACQAA